MSDEIVFPWRRFWIPHGETPSMSNGYFAPPTPPEEFKLGPVSNGVSLSQVAATPCLVLLGDVGMGKSTTIRNEFDRLNSTNSEPHHEWLFYDLKRMTESQIVRSIFEHKTFKNWAAGKHSLTLFLDSLDECWRRIDELESILVGELERALEESNPEMPLFLRLTCRSAEWRGSVGSRLQNLFEDRDHETNTQILRLAPLSEINVREAAQRLDLDAHEFLKSIAAKDAEPLASHPVTLRMLLEIFRAGGDFPDSRAGLYELGCIRLCEERYSEPSSAKQRITTTQQRFAVARRLAALSVLTNRYLIAADTESSTARSDALEAAEAAGLFPEPAGNETVDIHRDSIRETMQTGLFAKFADGCQAWRHQSYAEFLAARYLSDSDLSDDQILSLITDTSDNANRLIPQLEETACWLVDLRPSLFDRLADSNADVLIRCDVGSFSDDRRAQLVAGYLDLIRRHEAPEVDWQLKQRFSNLIHTDLESQLGEVIADATEHPLVRESAIEIAGYANLVSVGSRMVDAMLNPDEIYRIRKAAAHALSKLANDEIRDLLQAKATAENVADSHDEVLGYYLRIMWPERIQTDELLASLERPRKRNYTGSYRYFLEYEFPASVEAEDLPSVLDWIRNNSVSFDILAPFGRLPWKILARAVCAAHDSACSEAVIGFLGGIQSPREAFWLRSAANLELSTDEVRSFWTLLISSDLAATNPDVIRNIIASRILSNDDVCWLIWKITQTSDESVRNQWRELLFSAIDLTDSEVLALVWDLAQQDPVTRERLEARTSCKIPPDERNWEKQNYYDQLHRQGEEDDHPSFNEILKGLLKQFDDGKTFAFWHIVDLLWTDPKDPREFNSPTVKIADSEAWQSISDDDKQRVLSAAVEYLHAQSVNLDEVWSAEDIYRPYNVALPTLVLLYDEDRVSAEKFGESIWTKWIAALIAYHHRHNGSHDEAVEYCLARAFKCAESEAVDALSRFLEEYVNNDNQRLLIWRLNPVWRPAIKKLCLKSLHDSKTKPRAAQDLFLLLASNDPTDTRQALELLIIGIKDDTKCSVLTPVAASVLITEFTEDYGERLLDLFVENPEFGKRVMYLTLRQAGRRPGWLSLMPANVTARLWEWMEAEFSYDPWEQDDEGSEFRARTVTSEHEMFDLKRAVLDSLRSRQTKEACSAMESLAKRRPQDFWLGDVLAEMRKSVRQAEWSRPHPTRLLQQFADAKLRLIRTAGDLKAALLESLQAYQEKLHGNPPSMELWNEETKDRKKLFHPKDENNLSNCLKLHFDSDLQNRGIISGREVEIRPRLGDDPAQLVDVLVSAIPFDNMGAPGDPVTVVVEVKCAWNSGVMSDMEDQLFHRYLASGNYENGIFMVASFRCDGWNTKQDYRWTTGESKTPPEELKEKLVEQAADLSTSEKRIDAFVLDARITKP